MSTSRMKRFKRNSENWFDGEVLQKIRSRDKLFKAFKNMKPHINKELYKKAKYDILKSLTAKEQAFLDEKLSEIIGKPKKLWKILKSLGMSKKAIVSNFNAIDNNKSLTYVQSFQKFLLKFRRISAS